MYNAPSSRLFAGLTALIAAGLLSCASGGSPADASGDAGDDADVGGSACRSPRIICNGTCVDPQTDAEHCGDCDRACLPGEFCSGSTCADSCLPGEVLCGESCVNLDRDPTHCGNCETACVGAQTCQTGTCVCAGGGRLCGVACVQTGSDVLHCGDCDRECKSGEECQSGECVPVCQGVAVMCNGICVDTRNNNDFCGDCETVCGTNETCVDSNCECAAGREECAAVCVDTNTNADHCGDCDVPCPDGGVCRGGDCDCPPGRTLCDEECVDTQRDSRYCGDCETNCGDGLCLQSECVDECPDGQEVCADQCVDTQTDGRFCGNCTTACRPDEDCVGGLCECPDGFEECDGLCVNVDESEDYCGDCDTSCDAGEVCRGGECGCAGTLELCAGACVNTQTSGLHCGECNEACGPLEFCLDGDCTCIGGLDRCGEACVQVGEDPQHCLGCNMACEAGAVCSEGACQDDCPGSLVSCDGACVDLDTDPGFCGDCDTSCALFEVCEGDCVCLNDIYEFDFPEPNDSLDQAMPLPIGTAGGTPHYRNLRLCEADVDWYSIFLPSAGASLDVLIDADCSQLEPRLSIWDETADVELASAEAVDGVCPELVVTDLPAGWVNLRVESMDGAGPYDLFVFPENLVEVEPNDSPDDAGGTYTADVDVAGDLAAPGDDFDTFVFFNPRPGRLILETTGGGSGCVTDTIVYVTDVDGTVLGQDDDGGSGVCSRLELELIREYVYVTVFGYLADTVGPYELVARFEYLTESEPNSGDEFEGPFTTGFGVEGTIFPPFDVDTYRLELTEVSTIRAFVDGIGFGCSVDSVLSLANEDLLVELGGDDDFDESDDLASIRGLGWCSIIDPFSEAGPNQDFAADLAPGTYSLSVSAFSDRVGLYNLDVEIVPAGE